MSGKTTMSAKEQLRGRRDKAALLQTGRLAERRLNREEQDHQNELQNLQRQLDEAQREATMAKGGGGAMKELQKELADLRVTVRPLPTLSRDRYEEQTRRAKLTPRTPSCSQLAESEAALVAATGERDTAVKERDDVLAGRPGAPQAVLRKETERATALEKEIKALQAQLAQADERTAEAAAGAGNSSEEMEAREKRVQEMETRCSTMQQVRLLSLALSQFFDFSVSSADSLLLARRTPLMLSPGSPTSRPSSCVDSRSLYTSS